MRKNWKKKGGKMRIAYEFVDAAASTIGHQMKEREQHI
jgi:hypothetical protein